ncbi:MAG: hypothetical protein Q9174_003904 [Haloplaca sp. 1 TL-2023]
MAAYILMAVVSAWCIQQILTVLLLCQPIAFNWDGSLNGHCGDVAANCLAGAAVNTLTDILILILPMPTIWRLHVPFRSKVILSLVFGLGSFICIISIIRLRTLFFYTTAPMMVLLDSDGTHDNNLPILYTVLESSLGVICACVVLMKPVFTHPKLKLSWKSSGSGDSTGALSKSTDDGYSRSSRMAVGDKNASAEEAVERAEMRYMHAMRQNQRLHHPRDLEAGGERLGIGNVQGGPENLVIRETRDIEVSFDKM